MFRKIIGDDVAQQFSYAGSAIAWWKNWAASPSSIMMVIPVVIPAAADVDYANTTLKTVATLVSGNAGTKKETLSVRVRHNPTGDPGTIEVSTQLTTTANARTSTVNIPAFDLDDLAAAYPTAMTIVVDVTNTGSNLTTKTRVVFASDLALTGRTISSTLFSATSSTSSTTLLGVGEDADFFSIGGVNNGAASHNGAYAGPTARKGQQLLIGSIAVYTGNALSDADLQAAADRKDAGIWYWLHRWAASMSGQTCEWIENCLHMPADSGQAIFTDGSNDTALGDPNARYVEAGVRVFDSDQTSSPDLASNLIGIPTAGDVDINGATMLAVRPTLLGVGPKAMTDGDDGISLGGRSDVTGRAPSILALLNGTVKGTKQIVLFTANSRENANRQSSYPRALTYADSDNPTEASLVSTTNLSYASDYASTLVGGISAMHSVGIALAARSGGRAGGAARFGGYCRSIRNIADLPGPFLDRDWASGFSANCNDVFAGTSGLPGSEEDNIADLSRILFSGPNSDNGSGLGLGEGTYLNPSTGAASTGRIVLVNPFADRNPEDPLSIIVMLPKLPGWSSNVRIERGYMSSGGSWTRVDDAYTGIDLDTAEHTAKVNAYTATATAIDLDNCSTGASVRQGDMIVWRRGATNYFGVGCYAGTLGIDESAGSMTVNPLEFALGSNWISGATQGYPKATDDVWIGKLEWVAYKVDFTAAELDGTTGTFDNNWPGIKVFNEDTGAPALWPQAYPLTEGCMTVGSMGQSGANYGIWNGLNGQTKRAFNTVWNGGGYETTPLGRFLQALSPYLAGVVMKGAQQQNTPAAMVRILETIRAAAPAADRVVCADRCLPKAGDPTMGVPDADTNDTYWNDAFDAVQAYDATIPIVVSTLLANGHPWSQNVDGWLHDNQHQNTTGSYEEGVRAVTAMLDTLRAGGAAHGTLDGSLVGV